MGEQDGVGDGGVGGCAAFVVSRACTCPLNAATIIVIGAIVFYTTRIAESRGE